MEQEHAQTALGTPSRELRTGFTLIELLVVIAIISLLVSILLPSLQKAKELARTVVCLSNQRSLTFEVAFYTNEHNGYLPGLEWGIRDHTGAPWFWSYLGEPEYMTYDDIWTSTEKRDANWQLTACPTVNLPYNNRPAWVRGMDIGYNWYLGHPNTTMWGAYHRVNLDQVLRPQETVLMGDTATATTTNGSSYGIMEWVNLPEYRHSDKCNFMFVAGQGETLGGREDLEPDYFIPSAWPCFFFPMARPF